MNSVVFEFPLSPLSLLFLSAGVVLIGVATATDRVGARTRVQRWFVVLLLADAAWALSSVVPLEAASEPVAFAGMAVWVTTSSLAALSWFTFGMVYTGRTAIVSRSRVAAVAAPLVFHVAAFVTNPVHGHSVDGFVVSVAPVTTVVEFEMGLVYGLLTGYALLLTLSASALVAVSAVRDTDLYADQSVALLVGSIAPIVGVVLTVAGVTVPGVATNGETSYVPATLTVTAVGYGYALFRTDLLSAGPLVVTAGRRVAVETLDEGFLIVDSLGRVAEANRAATELLDASTVVGRDVEAVVPGIETPEAGRTVVRTEAGTAIEAQVTALEGVSGGQAITLRDVTERQRRRERLEVLNRVLRHNLRNDLNVVRGFAQQIASDATDEMSDAEAADRIVDRADGLLEVAENARAVERLLDAESTVERESVDLCDLTTALAGEVRRDAERPVELVTDVPGTCRLQSNEAVLEMVLSEVLDNAVSHNDSAEPTVWLSVTADDAVRISVADDGPGIPEHDRQAVLSGSENSLEHGSRLGLWTVRWGVRYLGGTLSIEDHQTRGTVVEITLPRGETSASSVTPASTGPDPSDRHGETAIDGGRPAPGRAENPEPKVESEPEKPESKSEEPESEPEESESEPEPPKPGAPPGPNT